MVLLSSLARGAGPGPYYTRPYSKVAAEIALIRNGIKLARNHRKLLVQMIM